MRKDNLMIITFLFIGTMVYGQEREAEIPELKRMSVQENIQQGNSSTPAENYQPELKRMSVANTQKKNAQQTKEIFTPELKRSSNIYHNEQLQSSK